MKKWKKFYPWSFNFFSLRKKTKQLRCKFVLLNAITKVAKYVLMSKKWIPSRALLPTKSIKLTIRFLAMISFLFIC